MTKGEKAQGVFAEDQQEVYGKTSHGNRLSKWRQTPSHRGTFQTPRAVAEKCQSLVYPRVADEFGGVPPLENLRPDGGGNEEAVLLAETRVRVFLLSLRLHF